MGAATSIFYAAEHEGLASCLVLDSSYSTLTGVIDFLAKEKMGVPPMLADFLIIGIKT
jgi:hypothetical protein